MSDDTTQETAKKEAITKERAAKDAQRASGRKSREVTRLRKRRMVHRQAALADWVVDIVELRFDLVRGAVRRDSRRSMRIVQARHLAAYLMHTELGLSQAATARVLGRHRTTVLHSLRQMEDARDDPVLNRHVESLTNQLDTLREVTR